MKAIKKVVFKAQNTGDSVKVNTSYVMKLLVLNDLQIAIPYSAILDVERSTAMDFSETIEVKVVDKEDHFAIDSYFFAYFRDLSGALDQIRDAVRTYRTSCSLPENASSLAVLDSTVSRTPSSPDRAVHTLPEPASPKATSGFKLSSIFRPLADTFAVVNRASTLPSELQNDDYTHVSRKPDSSSFIPITTSPKPIMADSPISSKPNEPNSILRHSTQSLPPPDHTYPPSTPSSSISPNYSYLSRDNSNSWAVGVPSWLRSPRRVFGPSLSNMDPTATFNSTQVSEVYTSAVSSSGPISRPSSGGEMTFSILETPDIKPDQETAEKFRAAFAYDEKETLLGCASYAMIL
jgi:sterol 3beta-glucosyltransferase